MVKRSSSTFCRFATAGARCKCNEDSIAQDLALSQERDLDIFEPTPSQAAFILRRRLKDSGVNIPLSLAQECFAQSRGFQDWNTLTAFVAPRATSRAKQGQTSKLQLFDQLDSYPHELSELPISRWVECFDACWPAHLHQARTEDDRARLMPLWHGMDFSENFEMERRLRQNLYLAVAASSAMDEFHYIAGAIGVGTAERTQSLQLVFQKRIGNRFSLNVCPALNWDGIKVEFVIYEFGDVLGDAHVGELVRKPVISNPAETLIEFLSRALLVAEKIQEDFSGWMNIQGFMGAFEA
jgi:hypothetical protein